MGRLPSHCSDWFCCSAATAAANRPEGCGQTRGHTVPGSTHVCRRLHEDGTASGEHSTVKPRLGSAVLFYQGAPQFAHLPHTVTRGSKEILRADIMYRFESADAADVGGLRVGRCRNASVQ